MDCFFYETQSIFLQYGMSRDFTVTALSYRPYHEVTLTETQN